MNGWAVSGHLVANGSEQKEMPRGPNDMQLAMRLL